MGLIGASHPNGDSHVFAEYSDGTFLHDGFFFNGPMLSSLWIDDAMNNYAPDLSFSSAQTIVSNRTAPPLCEIFLEDDRLLCFEASEITEVNFADFSTSNSYSSLDFASPSQCMQLCYIEASKYAVLHDSKCICSKSLDIQLFLNKDALIECPKSSRSNQFNGKCLKKLLNHALKIEFYLCF